MTISGDYADGLLRTDEDSRNSCTSPSVRVFRWHPEPPHSVAFEVKLDHHGRFVPDHPSVVTRFYRDRLRRRELRRASVGVLDMDLPLREEPNVRVLAEFCPDDRLYVARPAESRRVDDPFHPAVARARRSIWTPPISRWSAPSIEAVRELGVIERPPVVIFYSWRSRRERSEL